MVDKKTIKEVEAEKGFKKQIKKVGDSAGIIFNKSEIEKYNLQIGNILNLDDAFVEGGGE